MQSKPEHISSKGRGQEQVKFQLQAAVAGSPRRLRASWRSENGYLTPIKNFCSTPSGLIDARSIFTLVYFWARH